MSSPAALADKAKQCLAKAAPIPGAPLLLMARGTTGTATTLQNAIDYLSCKAKAKLAFDEDEKEFLRELFEALWWGGKAKGLYEAAELANHYVNGKGETLKIGSYVYESAVIVQDTMAAMKGFIKASAAKKKHVPRLVSHDQAFMRSPEFAAVSQRKGRNVNTQGYVLPDGALLTEQQNTRLKNTDHRFHLQAQSMPSGKTRLHTRWRVDSIYDFEPFEKADYVTTIPLGDGVSIKLPDGLSHYMTALRIAADFNYWTEWHEHWTV
jgi:hypothetical protein